MARVQQDHARSNSHVPIVPPPLANEELLSPIEDPPPILTAAEPRDELAWRRQAFAASRSPDEEPLESPAVQARLRRLQALMRVA